MELRRHLVVLRRRLWLIILCTAIGVTVAYLTTSRTSVYSARARIYVGAKQISAGAVSNDLLTGLERIIRTYSLMIDSQPIAADALKLVPQVKMSADGLVAATSAVPEQGTQLLTVKVANEDPAVAQQLANALTTAFVDKIQTYDPSTPPQAGQPPQQPAYIFETARLPSAPAASQVPRRVILGFLFGLVFSAGVAFLLEYMDITVKNVSDAERRLELPVLGVIPVERQRALVPVDAKGSVVSS